MQHVVGQELQELKLGATQVTKHFMHNGMQIFALLTSIQTAELSQITQLKLARYKQLNMETMLEMVNTE